MLQKDKVSFKPSDEKDSKVWALEAARMGFKFPFYFVRQVT